MVNKVQPNGEFREVGVDELFFSITDGKGIIEESNSTFVNLSRYSEEELHGAPHNIIRHPYMPAGIFHLMWERLNAGKSFAGYVRNLAADGLTYDVFATVTPVPGSDDLLSVRQRPCHNDHHDLAMTVYKALSEKEAELAAQGLGRREVAAAGAKAALETLAGAGFSTFDDYMSEMLYWEVRCREGMSEGLPQRPYATGEWAQRLEAAMSIHSALDEWVESLNALMELADRANEAQAKLIESLGRAASIKEHVEQMATNSEALQVLSFQLNVWVGMQNILDSYVQQLAELLASLVSEARESRLVISITRLHATMLTRYVAQVIDMKEADPEADIEVLQRRMLALRAAATDSVETMERKAFARKQLVQRTVARLRSVVSIMSSPHELLVDANDNASQTAPEDLAQAVRQTLSEAEGAISEMEELANVLESAPVAPDATAVLEALDRFRGMA